MGNLLKKQHVGGWFLLIAAIAGIVGVIAMLVSNGYSSAYALKGTPMLVLMGIGGVLLCLVAMWTPTLLGNHDVVSTFAILGAVALFSAVMGSMILSRILMVAGLFSYNSQNATGWSVFYAMVVSAAAIVAADLILVIGACLPSVRKSAAK